MAKFVLAYRGGSMAETEAEQQAVMQAWMGWFGALGASVIDGGNPFEASAMVSSDGTVSHGGTAALTGYSILSADSLDAALALAKGCPVLSSGGTVDVYAAHDMG